MDPHISVLFVDDDPGIRRLAALTLGRRGLRVETVADGVEALQRLQGAIFDVAVVDLLMPQKEGLATIMEMREHAPSMRIIAISGGGYFDAAQLTQLAVIVGADRALTKPFTYARLAEAIEDLARCDKAAA